MSGDPERRGALKRTGRFEEAVRRDVRCNPHLDGGLRQQDVWHREGADEYKSEVCGATAPVIGRGGTRVGVVLGGCWFAAVVGGMRGAGFDILVVPQRRTVGPFHFVTVLVRVMVRVGRYGGVRMVRAGERDGSPSGERVCVWVRLVSWIDRDGGADVRPVRVIVLVMGQVPHWSHNAADHERDKQNERAQTTNTHLVGV